MARYMRCGCIRVLPGLVRLDEAIGTVRKYDYYMSNIAVYPAWRGKRVGSALMFHAEAVARQRGLRSISLDVEVQNAGAIHWYNRLGFRVAKETVVALGGRSFRFYRMSMPLK